MQKKLISLAIAGALAVPGAAMADATSNITIYGKFHASWDFIDNDARFDGATTTAPVAGGDDSDDNTAVFRNSRLGFKGDEDLGGGLKAIWQVETDLETGDHGADNGNMELRNTFVGLQGDNWGKVFMGKHDTPYKSATAKLDIFSDTIADYNNIIGTHLRTDDTTANVTNYLTPTSSFNARPDQVVAYETPNFSGFKAQVARISTQNNEANGVEERESWSAMGMYDQGPFFASLAYETHSGGNADSSPTTGTAITLGDEKIDAWKVGLGYAFNNDNTKLGFVYEDIDHDDNTASGNLRSRDAFWVSGSHKFGNSALNLAYGKADDSDVANSNDGADTWAIGVDHNFSKRTKVYAIYTEMDNDANANYGLNSEDGASTYQPGTTASTGVGTGTNLGGDVKAFSVGIIHKF